MIDRVPPFSGRRRAHELVLPRGLFSWHAWLPWRINRWSDFNAIFSRGVGVAGAGGKDLHRQACELDFKRVRVYHAYVAELAAAVISVGFSFTAVPKGVRTIGLIPPFLL